MHLMELGVVLSLYIYTVYTGLLAQMVLSLSCLSPWGLFLQ